MFSFDASMCSLARMYVKHAATVRENLEMNSRFRAVRRAGLAVLLYRHFIVLAFPKASFSHPQIQKRASLFFPE
jgi:hypothetical protein